MIIETGKLIRWLDDKGFGFIKPDKGGKDIFIHISALRSMSRAPMIGDVIHYEIGFDANGKTRAVNASIEGVSRALTLEPQDKKRKDSLPTSHKQRPYRRPANFSEPQKRFNLFPIVLVMVLAVAVFVYIEVSNEKTFITPVTTSVINAAPVKPVQKFHCQGKVWCSQMSSYDEAVFYLRNCPSTKMDGDNDGIPCEDQF